MAILSGQPSTQLLGWRGGFGRQNPFGLVGHKVLHGLLHLRHVGPDQQRRRRHRGHEGDRGVSRQEPEAAAEDGDGEAGRAPVSHPRRRRSSSGSGHHHRKFHSSESRRCSEVYG